MRSQWSDWTDWLITNEKYSSILQCATKSDDFAIRYDLLAQAEATVKKREGNNGIY